MGTPACSRTSRTPMCAIPQAAPLPSAIPTLRWVRCRARRSRARGRHRSSAGRGATACPAVVDEAAPLWAGGPCGRRLALDVHEGGVGEADEVGLDGGEGVV